MEHLAKFIQVGPSNALFSQIRFIQPNDDWLSIQRFKAIEVKLCNVLETKLPDVISLKPGALESVNGDLTLDDVKVTYNMKKRANLPKFVMVARKDDAKWEARKAKHVDESICKFKDYGGMFERKAVLKSELTVSIRRLTTSELAQQAKVQNSQTSQNNSPRGISSYFKPAAVPRPKTPDEKAALKRLLDRREAKKRHLSSSDSESNSASENFEAHKSKRRDRKLAPPTRGEMRKDSNKAEGDGKKFVSLSQPVPEKCILLQDATHREEDRVSATQVSKSSVAASRGGSPSVRSGWSRHHDHRADVAPREVAPREVAPREVAPREVAPREVAPRDHDKPKTSSHRGEKEKMKSHDASTAAASSRGSSSSREKEHKTRSEHKETRERSATSHSQKAEKESSKSSRSGKEKEPAQEKSRHHRDKRNSPPKKSSSHREEKSSSKRSHEQKGREQKSKQSKMKQANIKQLLTDCGIDDSDDSDAGAAQKKERDETSRRSPDSTQQVDVRVVPHTSKSNTSKRESLDDFRSKKESSQAVPSGAKRQKQTENVLSKSLFLEDDENSDESDDDKPRQETSCKSPTTEDDAPAIDVAKQAARSSPEMDSYEPTPVARLATEAEEDEESVPSKPAGASATSDEEVSKLTRTPPHRESYVPSYRRTPTRPEALSYNPSSPRRQEEKRKKKDPAFEYIPSSIGPSSAAKPSRGRYEEYVPEAVNRSARHQQSTMEYIPTYIPTPKREINSDVSTTTYSSSPLSEVPETKNQPGNTFVPSSRVEREIRNARDVKDLEERHIRYLFEKSMPEMEGIIAGKIESWRRRDYYKGGKAKRMLTYQVFFSPFSDKQMSVITNLFMEEYIQKGVNGDYLNQVLMPEFLIRVFMANKGTSAEESDRLMAETPFNQKIPRR
ncbi:neurofilament heavy polypeptide isoform X39 [Dermacentor silvarum]|uniref:neurofilament heavy polypeptide isoform X39 n=1 Tax=Dermacentor silvarum TaxID=543639 RepID=UPI0021016422|nr:neurofilament heavy polypeptide isoform X39 [Dermacentor silvarum]